MNDIRTLFGDRYVEHPWILSHLDDAPDRVLDLGCGNSPLTAQAAHLCGKLYAVDLQDVRQPDMPNLTVFKGDIRGLNFQADYFDMILNCSTIEHVGIAGRYGVMQDDLDADLEVMAALARVLKPGGRMLLTLPIGKDTIIRPYHRVYGDRLKKLMKGWRVLDWAHYGKPRDSDIYRQMGEEEAIAGSPTDKYYALGLFTLEKVGD